LFAESLAENPSTPEDILREIFEEGEGLWQLSKNPSIPKDIFPEIFKQHTTNALGNPACPVELLQATAETISNEADALAIARNHSCPRQVLESLSKKYDGLEAKLAKATLRRFSPGVYAHLASHPSLEVRKDIAQNKYLPKEIQEALSQDSSKQVRDIIAKRGSF
jgi:hypothetical protein